MGQTFSCIKKTPKRRAFHSFEDIQEDNDIHVEDEKHSAAVKIEDIGKDGNIQQEQLETDGVIPLASFKQDGATSAVKSAYFKQDDIIPKSNPSQDGDIAWALPISISFRSEIPEQTVKHIYAKGKINLGQNGAISHSELGQDDTLSQVTLAQEESIAREKIEKDELKENLEIQKRTIGHDVTMFKNNLEHNGAMSPENLGQEGTITQLNFIKDGLKDNKDTSEQTMEYVVGMFKNNLGQDCAMSPMNLSQEGVVARATETRKPGLKGNIEILEQTIDHYLAILVNNLLQNGTLFQMILRHYGIQDNQEFTEQTVEPNVARFQNNVQRDFAMSPPNCGQNGAMSPPNFGQNGAMSPPNFGQNGAMSPPNFGQIGAMSTPNFGQHGVISQKNFGQNSVISPTNFGQNGPTSSPNLGQNGAMSPTNFEQNSAISRPNFGQHGVISQTNFVQNGVISPTNFGQNGATSSPNLGQNGAMSPTNFEQNGAISRPNFEQHGVISQTNIGQNVVISPTNFGQNGATSSPNLGQNGAMSPTNFEQNGAISRPNFEQHGVISQTNFGQNCTMSPPYFGQHCAISPPNFGQNCAMSPPNFGQNGAMSPPNFGQNGVISQTNFGQNGAMSPPNFGQIGAMSPPNFGQNGVISPTNFGQNGATSSPNLGQNGAMSPTNFEQNGAISRPNFEQHGVISQTNFGQNCTMSPPYFGQHGAISPPNFGQNCAMFPPNFGQHFAIPTTNCRQNSAMSPPTCGQNSAISPTTLGQNSTLSPPTFGQNGAMSAPNNEQNCGMYPPKFEQNDVMSPPTFGQNGVISPTNYVQNGAMSLQNLGEGAIARASFGNDGLKGNLEISEQTMDHHVPMFKNSFGYDGGMSPENLREGCVIRQVKFGHNGAISPTNLGQNGTILSPNIRQHGAISPRNLEEGATARTSFGNDGLKGNLEAKLGFSGEKVEIPVPKATEMPLLMVSKESIKVVIMSTPNYDVPVFKNSEQTKFWKDSTMTQADTDQKVATAQASFEKPGSKGVTLTRNRPPEMLAILEAWKREDIYETKCVKVVKEKISSNGCVCVIGVPGAGKSTALHHAALSLEKEGFVIYLIDEPKEILRCYNESEKQVFVMDDVLGVYSMSQRKADVWVKYNDIIKVIIGTHSKLLVAIRTQLYKNQNVSDKNIVFLEKSLITDHVDFGNADYQIGINEMRGMLTHFMRNKGIDSDYISAVIRQLWPYNEKELTVMAEENTLLGDMSWYTAGLEFYECFPLICKIFVNTDFVKLNPEEFFKKPFPALTKVFKSIKSDNQLQFCALVLCAVFDGKLNDDMFSGICELNNELDKNDVEIRNVIIQSCIPDKRQRHLQDIKSALTSLIGIYVTHIGGTYEIAHDVFHDIVTYLYDDPLFVFKYGTREFICDRVRINKDDQRHDPFVILCSDNKSIERLGDRLVRDLKTDTKIGARFIAYNPNIHDDRLISCLRSKLFDRQLTDKKLVDELFRQCMLPALYQIYIYKHGDVTQYKLIELCVLSGLVDNELIVEFFRKCIETVDDYRNIYTHGYLAHYKLIQLCIQTGVVDKQLLDEFFKRCMLSVWWKRNTYSHGDVNHYKLIELCVQSGVDCNMFIEYGVLGRYPLDISVRTGSLQLTRLLLDNGADKRRVDSDGCSVLHCICSHTKYNKLELVKLLTQHVGDQSVVKFITNDRHGILEKLERDNDNLQLEEVLSDRSIKVLTTDKHKMKDYVKHHTGTLQLVKHLHDNILTYVDNNEGRNILHLSTDDISITRYVFRCLCLSLLEHAINDPDKSGRTPFWYVVNNEHPDKYDLKVSDDDREDMMQLYKDNNAIVYDDSDVSSVSSVEYDSSEVDSWYDATD